MSNKKVTLTSEELATLLTAASMWFATAEDPKDPEITEMVQRGQAILRKVHDFTDKRIMNKTSENTLVTFDLIANDK